MLLWWVSWWYCQACIPLWVASLSSSLCFWNAGGKTVSNPSFAVHNVGGSCMHKQGLEAFINLSLANGFLFLVLTGKCKLCQAQNTVFARESLSDSPSLTWGLSLNGTSEIFFPTTFPNSVQLPGRGAVYYGKSAGMFIEAKIDVVYWETQQLLCCLSFQYNYFLCKMWSESWKVLNSSPFCFSSQPKFRWQVWPVHLQRLLSHLPQCWD